MAFTEKARDRPEQGAFWFGEHLQMINAHWLLLEHLSLHTCSSNFMATDVMTQLIKGEWPLLRRFKQASFHWVPCACSLLLFCCR